MSDGPICGLGGRRAGYDAVYERLIQVAELTDVSSSFAMERIKHTTELPLAYAR